MTLHIAHTCPFFNHQKQIVQNVHRALKLSCFLAQSSTLLAAHHHQHIPLSRPRPHRTNPRTRCTRSDSSLDCWVGLHSKKKPSAVGRRRRRATGVAQYAQIVILAPSLSINLASHAGWAGHAGAVTRLPSTCAASMAMAI